MVAADIGADVVRRHRAEMIRRPWQQAREQIADAEDREAVQIGERDGRVAVTGGESVFEISRGAGSVWIHRAVQQRVAGSHAARGKGGDSGRGGGRGERLIQPGIGAGVVGRDQPEMIGRRRGQVGERDVVRRVVGVGGERLQAGLAAVIGGCAPVEIGGGRCAVGGDGAVQRRAAGSHATGCEGGRDRHSHAGGEGKIAARVGAGTVASDHAKVVEHARGEAGEVVADGDRHNAAAGADHAARAAITGRRAVLKRIGGGESVRIGRAVHGGAGAGDVGGGQGGDRRRIKRGGESLIAIQMQSDAVAGDGAEMIGGAGRQSGKGVADGDEAGAAAHVGEAGAVAVIGRGAPVKKAGGVD